MREGANLCSECHAPIPPSRGKCARTCSPACRSRRDLRLKRERNTGNASGQGTPSPSPRGSPPSRRPPSEPLPPADPLPINDPTRELRRRLLAEAEALLALPHVEVVTLDVRAGEVRVLRSTGRPAELGGSFAMTAADTVAAAYGDTGPLDFGGAR